MKRINDIVSDAIDVRINDDNKDKTFDISKIDFERLRAVNVNEYLSQVGTNI